MENCQKGLLKAFIFFLFQNSTLKRTRVLGVVLYASRGFIKSIKLHVTMIKSFHSSWVVYFGKVKPQYFNRAMKKTKQKNIQAGKGSKNPTSPK